jgi:hypothetical protein
MRYVSGILKVFKNIVLVVLIILAVAALVGVFVYSLYRLATASRTLYSYIFLGVFSITILFFVARSIRRKTFLHIALKFARFFYGLIIFGAVLGILALLGAFLIRFPVAGAIAAPFVIGGVIVLFLKWRPFHIFKNISE